MSNVTLTREQLDSLLQRAIQQAPAASHVISEQRIREIVSHSIEETLVRLGICTDPMHMQRDFAFLRSMRLSLSFAKKTVIRIAVGAITAGLLSALYVGAKALWSQNGH